jgi:hypothetical protein
MAELTITTFLSLDGIMQAPGAPTRIAVVGSSMAVGWCRFLMVT